MRPVQAALAAVVLGGTTVLAGPVRLGEVRQNLFATCFPSDREGWMVGELGRIFRTTDGGTTWERQDAKTKRPFLAMTCLDTKRAWIAGKEGIVYRTSDGGTTWTQQPTGSNRHIFAIEFPNEKRGTAAGDYGTIVHTEDGGASWELLHVPEDVKLPEMALDTGVQPGDVNLYAISYGDENHVWLAGEFGIVMASDDGGRTWRQQQTPIESTLFGIRFTDARHGFAVGIDSTILRTDDGGATWNAVRSPIAARSLYDVVIRGQNGWIVGEAATVLKTTDGGATWKVEPLPIQLAGNWIRAVSIGPKAEGMAVGSEGLVFRLEGANLRKLEHDDAATATEDDDA